MTDLVLDWTAEGPDLALGLNDLAADDGLTTAVLVALFSDARASADDGLAGGADPRGHWGDAYTDAPLGSLLWLIEREKITPDLAPRIREHARAALQRAIVEPGLATAAEVEVTRSARDTLALQVVIDAPPGRPEPAPIEPVQIAGLNIALVIRAHSAIHRTLAQYEA